MLTLHLLATLLAATAPSTPAPGGPVWTAATPAAASQSVSDYRVERIHRTPQELITRAFAVLELFTSNKPKYERVKKWATTALAQDPAEFLQLHPLPEIAPGLVIFYQPQNDDLMVMDLTQLHDRPAPQFGTAPGLPDIGVGEQQARAEMETVVAELYNRGLIANGFSPASAKLGVYRNVQGNAAGEVAEWVTEYQWTMNRELDGVTVVDAGIRLGISRDGSLSSLRVTDVGIEPISGTSSPVAIDLTTAREALVSAQQAQFPAGVVHAIRERVAVVLDPSQDAADLTPSYLFNFSLRFEDPTTGSVSTSRQILTTVSLTTGNVHQVFPEIAGP